MTDQEFEEVFLGQVRLCEMILGVKAEGYAADNDRLYNFKCAGGMMNCNPKEALAGMMAKHTISVYDMCRSKKDYPMEIWEEKITDHLNYLFLLKAIIVEEKNKSANQNAKADALHTNPEVVIPWN